MKASNTATQYIYYYCCRHHHHHPIISMSPICEIHLAEVSANEQEWNRCAVWTNIVWLLGIRLVFTALAVVSPSQTTNTNRVLFLPGNVMMCDTNNSFSSHWMMINGLSLSLYRSGIWLQFQPQSPTLRQFSLFSSGNLYKDLSLPLSFYNILILFNYTTYLQLM
jgi:hypothetical protein